MVGVSEKVFHQFGALVHKGFIQRRRNLRRSLLEIFVPFGAILIITLVSYLIDLETVEQFIPMTNLATYEESMYIPVAKLTELYTQAEWFCADRTLIGRCDAEAPARWNCMPGEDEDEWFNINEVRNADEWSTFYEDDDNKICQPLQIAVAPKDGSSDATKQEARDFIDWGNAKYSSTSYPPYVYFASESAVEKHILDDKYTYGSRLISSAVIFNEGYPDWDLTIRMNRTVDSARGRRRMPRTIDPPMNPELKRNDDEPDYGGGPPMLTFLKAWATSGFFTLSDETNSFIAQRTCEEKNICDGTDDTVTLHTRAASGFPTEEYDEPGLWNYIKDTYTTLVSMVMLYTVSSLISAIMQEKESKLRETLYMMSVRPVALFSSYHIYALMTSVPCSFFLTLLTKSRLYANSDGWLIFWQFQLFFMSCAAFATVVSQCLSTVRSASLVGNGVFFVGYFLFELLVSTDSRSRGLAMFFSLHPLAGFGIVVSIIAKLEVGAVGLTSYTVDVQDSLGMSFNDFVGMTILSIILQIFLCWYLGEVVPRDAGTNRPWYFLFQRTYWMETRETVLKVLGRSSGQDSKVHVGEEGAIEMQEMESAAVPSNMAQITSLPASDIVETVPDETSRHAHAEGVCIRNLVKSFKTQSGTKVAVDGLSLDVYPDQVTVLLGHNGAGKTTAIGVMTGLTPATSGSVTIGGRDTGIYMGSIRQKLGVCPQHDVLFMELTVEEHLRLFATLKNVSKERISAAVDEIISEVGLVAKRHSRAGQLSGGQKRKLSIAIAFIGDSKIVFLDEPTSGMDPYSRRFTWNLISRLKKGRVIILTTHFMDEADILGDRIAIMGKGKLKCCGSSLFLKSKFGIGYNITLEKRLRPHGGFSFDRDAFENKLGALAIDGWRLLSDVGAEVIYQLPFAHVQAFPKLLRSIEDSQDDLGLQSYSTSMTTLEEVFMKVSDDHEGEEEEGDVAIAGQDISAADPAGSASVLEKGSVTGDGMVDVPASLDGEKEDIASTWYMVKHAGVMVYKRALIARADYIRTSLFLILVPVIVLGIGLTVLKSTNFNPSMPSYKLDAADLNPDVTKADRFPIPMTTSGTYRDEIQDKNKEWFDYWYESAELPYVGRNDSYSLSKNTAAGVNFDKVGGDGGYNGGGDMEETFATTLSSGFAKAISLATAESVYDVGKSLLNSIGDSEESTFAALAFQTLTNTTFGGSSGAAAGPLPNFVEYTAMLNFTSQYAGPLLAMAMGETMAKTFDEDATVTMRVHPLPETKLEESFSNAYSETIIVTFTAMALPFIGGFFASMVAKEKVNKTKYQQMLSGISLPSYWIGNLIWDVLCFLPFLFVWLIVISSNEKEIEHVSEHLDAGFLVMFSFGFALIAFVYFLSHFFSTAEGALLSAFAVILFFGLILGIVGFILRIIEARGIIDPPIFMTGLRYVFLCLPPYACIEGLYNIVLIERFSYDDLKPGKFYDPLDWNASGAAVTFLWIDFIIYFSLTILVDVWGGMPPMAELYERAMGKEVLDVTEEAIQLTKDDDVRAEEVRVEGLVTSGSSGMSEVVVTKNLQKKYPGKSGPYAVRGLSLGIPKGECFGLLGINGAGKSTTLSMLTGEVIPLRGDVYLDSKELRSNLHSCRRRIGFCPQFDAQFHGLTVKEHLRIYALVKGIPARAVEHTVATKIKEMDLTNYADKAAGTLSGGNRRKLSVAMAMIGEPSIVFLDEPSTGMDPVARRHMWRVITDTVKQKGECSVILTTHSMEEAEALCSRLGIMVSGTLRCLGSGQRLRARYAQAYQVEVSFPPERGVAFIADKKAETMALMESKCPGFHMLEEQPNKLRLDVPVNREDGSTQRLSDIFGYLEESREQLGIANYSVSQTSLEQIFNNFARMQEEEKLTETPDAAAAIAPLTTAVAVVANETE